VSIPANVAEGFGRCTKNDSIRFLDMAYGSANEVETHLLIAERLGFASGEQLHTGLDLAKEVQKIIRGLVDRLQSSDKPGLRSEGRL